MMPFRDNKGHIQDSKKANNGIVRSGESRSLRISVHDRRAQKRGYIELGIIAACSDRARHFVGFR